LVGQGDGLSAVFAWLYVVLRVIHSPLQATRNRVKLRFAVFALSSLVLIALILRAMIALV
ncbi:MAG: MAPEG family protein, partial [Altererythrobacter sp.]|nr:MAPEG family protein [Altererythrobacter sp.]